MFKKVLKKNNYSIALVNPYTKKNYTYSNIYSFKLKFEKNFKNKSVVLLISSNSIFSILSYVSLISSDRDIIVILLDENIKTQFIKKTIQKYKPNYILTNKKININKYQIKTKIEDYIIFENKTVKNENLNFLNKILIPTSGTTGNPKMVRLSYENLNQNSLSIIKSLRIKKKDTAITTMPMSYSYGLSILNTHLMCNARIVVCRDSIANKKFWEYFSKYRVTSLNGVPKFYEFLNKLKFENFIIKSLKYITQAGGNLDIKIKKYLYEISKKHNFLFYVMYGLSEASPRVSILNVTKNKEKIKSVGKPIPGVEVNIKKKNKKEGLIEILGKNISLGYSKNINDLKKSNENNFKFISEDIGYFDKDNFLFISNRLNKISKIFGLRINLNDFEKKLSEFGFKCECLSDDRFIFINTQDISDKEKIINLINKYFGINKNFIKVSKNNNNFKNKEFKV